MCVLFVNVEALQHCVLGLSVYGSISGEALRFRILPIMAVIKINKQLIDRPCFQFRPIISVATSYSGEDTLPARVPMV